MIDSILTGFADQRTALSRSGGDYITGAAITLDQVRSSLFDWHAIEGEITATAITADGVLSQVDANRKAIMRSDTGAVLGVMGNGYTIHQYDDWLATNVENLLDDTVQIQSAGTLNNGARAWEQIAAPDNLTGPGGFEYRPFILAATSLDGSVATVYKRNAIAIVCENTYRASLSSKTDQQVKFKHTRNSGFSTDHVREVLDILFETGDSFARELETLLSIKVAPSQFDELVLRLTPSTGTGRSDTIARNKAEDLRRLYEHDQRAATWKGTGLGVMQAMSTWRQQVATVKGGTRQMRNAQRLVDGTSDRFDLESYALLREVVGA